MAAEDLRVTRPAGPAGPDGAGNSADERRKLRRVLGRLDTVFFLISALVVADTIGAIAVGGGQAFTWLAILFVTFFVPSALISAELGPRCRTKAARTCGCAARSAGSPGR